MTGNGIPIVFYIAFFSVFFIVLVSILAQTIRNVARWRKNNQSPRLTVNAKIVAKRQEITRFRRGRNDVSDTGASTTYFVTFEVESGDRMELCMKGADYGMLVEGDGGRLTFQGTRFLSFERGC